jgi:hypothetical protein
MTESFRSGFISVRIAQILSLHYVPNPKFTLKRLEIASLLRKFYIRLSNILNWIAFNCNIL